MRLRTLCAFLALVLLGLPLQAKRSPGPTKVMGPDDSYSTARVGNRTVRLDTGAPTAIWNTGFQANAGTPEAMARQYLSSSWESLGLQFADLSDLEPFATRQGKATTVVRFRQMTRGVPVLGATLAVTLNRDGEVIYYSSTYVPATLDSAIPLQSADDARGIAFATLGLTKAPAWEDSELTAYYHAGETRLVYRTRQLSSEGLVGEWEVLTDALTGEVLRIQDTAYYRGGAGAGDVFLPDPLSTAEATYGDPGYTDGGDADTPQLVAEIFNQVFPDVTPVICVQGACDDWALSSPYAVLVDSESPFLGSFYADGSANWNFTRTEAGFEAANTFFHIDHFMRYMNETLGVTVEPYQYAGGARFDPHGLNGADNSHYSSGSGEVAFGEGGVDDAEDADVVIHELGHAIHDWVTNGGLSQVNGLSEGTGDYFAQSYSRGLGVWSPTDPAYHYVFSWDGHNPFWPGRVTNWGAVYPGGLTGSIHTDGQIWSTCNMRVWDAIGQQMMDTAMLEGLAMTNGSTNQENAAIAIMAAATAMNYPFSVRQAMFNIYSTCVYNVPPPVQGDEIFTDGFESGDTTAW